MGSKQTHVTVAEYISAFFFKYCSYGYGTNMAENAEKGADALLGMLRLVWQKGGREDMNTAFYSFKEQLVAARSMLPALQQLRVDFIFMLLEALLDAAEKLRQFSPYKEGAVLSSAVLNEARGRLHRIMVGDAFAGDHYVRRRALECCYQHLMREQGERARTMERQLRMPAAAGDAKPGRGRFGSSSSSATSGSLLRSLGGPDLSSWQGLWEALGSMSGARMLPLLESALADAASARQHATAVTAAAATAAAAAAPPRSSSSSSRRSADAAAAISSVHSSSVGTAASKQQQAGESTAVAVVAVAAAGTSNSTAGAQPASAATMTQDSTLGTTSSSSGHEGDPSSSTVGPSAAGASGTPLKAAAAAVVGRVASRRSSTSEWAATDSEPTTQRSSSFADELVREQPRRSMVVSSRPAEVDDQVATASSPTEDNLDWAQFPSSNSIGHTTAADTATADNNTAAATTPAASKLSAASGTAVTAAAANSKPGAKLQVHVQDAADGDVGGLDVSPFDMDSPVNWSPDLPACAQQLQQVHMNEQEQPDVCHTTHTISAADPLVRWAERDTAVA